MFHSSFCRLVGRNFCLLHFSLCLTVLLFRSYFRLGWFPRKDFCRLCTVSTILLPFFCYRFAVPVSHFCTPLPLPLPLRSIPTEFDGNQFLLVHRVFYIASKKLTIKKILSLCLGSSASMIGWPATEQRKK